MKPAQKLRIPGSRTVSSLLLLFLVITIAALLRTVHQDTQASSSRHITYRIGSVDARFNLTEKELSESARKAASIWAAGLNCELFQEDPQGALLINFVYDYRQESTDKLKGISVRMDNTKESYEALKSHLASLESDFQREKSSLESDLASYNTRVSDFTSHSDSASQSGSLSTDTLSQLKSEKDSLDSLRNDLLARQEELKRTIDTMNSLVVVINEIACNLNLDVIRYNKTGEKLRTEFSEGLYEERNGKRSITVFLVTSQDRLVRVLAHEFGHALGLGHIDNPKALMYRLNQSDSLELTPDDISALKTLRSGN